MTHLPRLLDEVAHGRSYTITKHGRGVARLIPVDADREDPAEVAAALKQLRAGLTLGAPVRTLVEEGRH